MRMFVSGAAALPVEVFWGFVDLGWPVLEGYGLTECAPVVVANDPERPEPGAVGRPLEGIEVRIHEPDEDGDGEVVVRGPNVMMGYWNQPDATAEVLRDGWFYTGVYDPTQGLALWRTNGTPAGTGPVLALGPSTLGSVFEAEVLGAGNRVWIQASDGIRGAEPWISAGTPATTTLLADVEPNGSSTAQLVGIAGERAYFTAFDTVRGRARRGTCRSPPPPRRRHVR